MKQVFVSANPGLRERWLQAFPGARVVPGLETLPGAVNGSRAILWLDLGTTPPAQRADDLRAAVATGQPVVVMSPVPGDAEAFQCLNQGAMGYCHSGAAPEQLREIATVVEHGGFWMPPGLMQRFLALSSRVIAPQPRVERELNELTSRELMVAEQVAHGASNREIASALNITERTVKAHLSTIFDKLGVRDRVQLALAMNNIPTYSTVN
ncbi:response regulator transcription factor [Mangrovimicrobium sediminis]|uniref:Response regulator transcription factor n=1 Tax=Mangrovimicrobium sediminis TaxID=2562682 RepID=A0A4Z0M337_9GAMM|nr:response regulator transcription factor [Haliea sp. SAOS-164]TGD73857.1 response regulator transcription factor [Haliea sp. SAOS-164]